MRVDLPGDSTMHRHRRGAMMTAVRVVLVVVKVAVKVRGPVVHDLVLAARDAIHHPEAKVGRAALVVLAIGRRRLPVVRIVGPVVLAGLA